MDFNDLPLNDLDFQLLLVTTSEVVHAVLELVLDGTGLRIVCERDVSSAITLATNAHIPVVLTTLDGDWKYLIRSLERVETPPSIIVMLPEMNGGLWAEVMNVGAYDAIVMGSRREEILAALASAYIRWDRRKSVHEAQVQNPLAHSI
jgi:hypothetical protein